MLFFFFVRDTFERTEFLLRENHFSKYSWLQEDTIIAPNNLRNEITCSEINASEIISTKQKMTFVRHN